MMIKIQLGLYTLAGGLALLNGIISVQTMALHDQLYDQQAIMRALDDRIRNKTVAVWSAKRLDRLEAMAQDYKPLHTVPPILIRASDHMRKSPVP